MKGFGARQGGHFPSAQQKILIEIAEVKNVKDLWGKPRPAIRGRAASAAPQIRGVSRISNPFFVQIVLMKKLRVEALGRALQEPHPCAQGAGASLVLPQPWGHPGGLCWPCLGGSAELQPQGSRRKMTFAPLAHHSGSPGDLTPGTRGSEHPSSADTGLQTCCQRQGRQQHSISFCKKQEKEASLCCTQGFLS